MCAILPELFVRAHEDFPAVTSAFVSGKEPSGPVRRPPGGNPTGPVSKSQHSAVVYPEWLLWKPLSHDVPLAIATGHFLPAAILKKPNGVFKENLSPLGGVFMVPSEGGSF